MASELRDLLQMDRFEDIRNSWDLLRFSEEGVWQSFEMLTAFIFEENGFWVSRGRVIASEGRRRQYDVIARKGGRTILVECKRWSGSRRRLSGLRTASREHKERSEFYRRLTGEHVLPVLVTLIEDGLSACEGAFVVSILRLNSFIDGIERGFDSLDVDGA
ncbi:MAG: restriction endonuclease [Methanothrix sp.]|nr:restriction endonuclease [Methanothrix sp.]